MSVAESNSLSTKGWLPRCLSDLQTTLTDPVGPLAIRVVGQSNCGRRETARARLPCPRADFRGSSGVHPVAEIETQSHLAEGADPGDRGARTYAGKGVP